MIRKNKNKKYNIYEKNSILKALRTYNTIKGGKGKELDNSSIRKFDKYDINEMKYLKEQLQYGGNDSIRYKQEIYELSKIINRKTVQEQAGLNRGQKAHLSYELNKQAKQELINMEKLETARRKESARMNEYINKSGVKGDENQYDILRRGIPQKALLDYTREQYVELKYDLMDATFKLSGEIDPLSKAERIKKLGENYDKAWDIFNNFNYEEVNIESYERLIKDAPHYKDRGMLSNMFNSLKHAGYDEDIEEMKSLIKELNIEQRANLEFIVTTQEFKRMWPSDQDDLIGSMEARLGALIDILRQETGKQAITRRIGKSENYEVIGMKPFTGKIYENRWISHYMK